MQARVRLTEKAAHVCHAERVFQKAAHKAVMNAFRCGMLLKLTNKGLILNKKSSKKPVQERIFYAVHIGHDFSKHLLHVFGRSGDVVRRIILSFFTLAETGDIHLYISLKCRYHAFTVDIIKCFETCDTVIKIPYFRIHDRRLILQRQGVICLSRFCL